MIYLRDRKTALLIFFGFVFFIFTARLFYMQILSPDFANKARVNVVKKKNLQPSRGIIYDRNGNIFVTNTPSFDLVVIPGELEIPDTAVFEKYLRMDRATIRKRILSAPNKYKPHILAQYLDFNVFYALQEYLWKCKGIYFEKRFSRDYSIQAGANFLGYIREVSKKDIDESGGYYRQGELKGITGLEAFYEPLLRGVKGVKMVMEDVHGREVGIFAEGQYDTLPVKGTDVVITVDGELQKFGEQLMINKKGAIVCIEPKTGEILAFVSAPVFDPKFLSGMDFSINYRKLARDTLKPLFNRALMATYPPGSIFKILNGIIGLEEGIIYSSSYYGCALGFARNKGRPACHPHPGPLDLPGAIQHSCNAYFAGLYVDMMNNRKYDSTSRAYTIWRNYMTAFGAGVKTGVDLPSEQQGSIPTAKLYDKWYGKKGWRGMTIVSNSIGQGEVTMTPLQMANALCAVANKGWYIQPHFFKRIFAEEKVSAKELVEIKKHIPKFNRINVPIDASHYDVITDAMEQVVAAGTGYLAQIEGIPVCGKTGTAQNTQGKDHSVFFAFAPKNDPQIAVAVIVENATWGGVWAAPIASLMIEKYLRREIKDKAKLQRILDANFIYTPPAYIANIGWDSVSTTIKGDSVKIQLR